jgi:hypothetical protein
MVPLGDAREAEAGGAEQWARPDEYAIEDIAIQWKKDDRPGRKGCTHARRWPWAKGGLARVEE